MVTGDQLERLLAGLGQVDVVAARLEVGRQGAPDRRLVVDDEHPRHRTATAEPLGHREADDHRRPAARGVLDRQLAVHRLDEAAGDRQPEADAGAVRRGGRRGAGTAGTPARGRRRGSRAPVDDADVDVPALAPDDARLRPGAGARAATRGRRSPIRLASARSNRAASASTSGSVSGTVDVDVGRPGAEAGDGGEHHLVDRDRADVHRERRRLQPAHVEQVADEVGEAVGLALDRRLELRDRRRAASRCRAGAGWRSTP